MWRYRHWDVEMTGVEREGREKHPNLYYENFITGWL